MNAVFKTLIHAFIGGGAVALSQIATDTPITSGNILLPTLAGGVTSVLSLFVTKPVKKPRKPKTK
jgi:hypothetical protein